MNYIVLDLEWNQPYDTNTMVKEPVLLYGEIIQIGAVKLDENYHILDTFKIMVSPKCYTKMHKAVAKLTGIKTEDLQYGFPFPVAFEHFSNWCGDDFAFLTWGPDDIEILRNNLLLHEIDPAWLPNAYNIQVIYDDQVSKERRKTSLSNAMKTLGEPALEAHDALNDAKNTVCVCLHLDMVKGLAEYALLQEQMHCDNCYAMERTRSSKTYSTREAALKDPELINFFCGACGSHVACVDFVRQAPEKFICIGKCENGNELFVRFKFAKCPNGNFSVTRLVYEISEEHKNYYLTKKQRAEEAEAAYLLRIANAGQGGHICLK